MRKIKTSISVEPDRLARLKRLAERERRSVSQLLDLAVDQLLPVLDHTDLTIEDLTGSPAHPSPKPKRKRAETRSSNLSCGLTLPEATR